MRLKSLLITGVITLYSVATMGENVVTTSSQIETEDEYDNEAARKIIGSR